MSRKTGASGKSSEEAASIPANHHESMSSSSQNSQIDDDGQKSFSVQLSYEHIHLELGQGIG